MNRYLRITLVIIGSLFFFLIGILASIKLFESTQLGGVNIEMGGNKKTTMTTKNESPKNKGEDTINVWVAGWDGQTALDSLKRSSGKIDYISPVFYHLTENGKINETDFKNKIEILDEIRRQNLKITPLIFNDFDPKRVGVFLNSDNRIETITDLVTRSKKNNYHGWDINWEQVSDSDQPQFIEFLKQTHEEFKKENIKLIVTVPAKTGDKSDWSGATGYNWSEIAKYSDEIRIMAYDYHNQSTKPGAVTPSDWFERVVRYAAINIPKEKITISLPLYGYKWDSNGIFLGSTTNQDKQKREAREEIVEGSVKYTFSSGDVVWTENKSTIEKKMEMAKGLGITNFSFWRLGAESLDFWQADQN